MTEQERGKLIDQLLDGGVELSDIDWEKLDQSDLVEVVQVLRGHLLRLSSLVGELSDRIRIVDAFAHPKTSRRYFYAPGKDKIIQ